MLVVGALRPAPLHRYLKPLSAKPLLMVFALGRSGDVSELRCGAMVCENARRLARPRIISRGLVRTAPESELRHATPCAPKYRASSTSTRIPLSASWCAVRAAVSPPPNITRSKFLFSPSCSKHPARLVRVENGRESRFGCSPNSEV